MRRAIAFLGFFLILGTVAAADEVTATDVVTALKYGATPEAVIARINNPANTVAQISPADLANLKAAGVPEGVIQALVAKAPAATPTPAPPLPDNPKLMDLAKMTKSGLSEPIILEQLKRSGDTYSLSPNDLVYLKAAGVPESIITYIVTNKNAPAPAAAAAPAVAAAPAAAAAVAGVPPPAPESNETTIEGLVLYRPTFMQKNRNGRLVFKEDVVEWVDAVDPKESFTFHMSGVENAWFTCQARPTESFCYQLNLQIVKGARYRFQDLKQETGSNEAIKAIESWIKKHFPAVPWGVPDVKS